MSSSSVSSMMKKRMGLGVKMDGFSVERGKRGKDSSGFKRKIPSNLPIGGKTKKMIPITSIWVQDLREGFGRRPVQGLPMLYAKPEAVGHKRRAVGVRRGEGESFRGGSSHAY